MKEKICENCKYHKIDEIAFDNPQSICIKRKAVIEKWFKCDKFEDIGNNTKIKNSIIGSKNDKEIKRLQQELQRKDNIINELKEYLEKQMKIWDKGIYLTYKEILDKIKELESENEVNKQAKAIQIYEKELRKHDNNWNELKDFVKTETAQYYLSDDEKLESYGWEAQVILDKINELESEGD